MGYPTLWLDQHDDITNIDFANTVFITEGQVDQNIPLRLDSWYVLHNCDLAKYKNLIDSNRAIVLQVYTNDVLSRGLEKLAPFIYRSTSDRTIYMPWATDLLPQEIDEVKSRLPLTRERAVYWIGTIGGGKFGNIPELEGFRRACQENQIDFNQKANLPFAEGMGAMQKSYIAPAIQGSWQVEKGYIPCRVFKAISYGQMGVTNSKTVSELFEDRIVYNSDTYQLFHDAEAKMATMPTSELVSLMDFVRDNHTYVNRINTLLDFLEHIGSQPTLLQADLVIFSYNRPIQLYALLESTKKLMTGIADIHVIYRADCDQQKAAFNEVAQAFTHVKFHQQGEHPQKDFKPLTMSATFDSPSDYIIFAVDDIVVKDVINVSESIDLMNKEHSYAFYLKMGRHLTWCYPNDQPQPLPPMQEVAKNVFAWNFDDGVHDWNYPHSVDMVIYRKRDIRSDFETMDFTNPNTLEGGWAGLANAISNRAGLCYDTTKMVNLPLNRVQSTHANRNMALYTAQQLLDVFNQGLKIDITPLFQIANPSVHMEYQPTFVERERVRDEL